MPEIKLPEEICGLCNVFYNNEGRHAQPHEASKIMMHFSSYILTFKWPEQAKEALILSKMIRDAYDAGLSAKASEIRACLEIPEME